MTAGSETIAASDTIKILGLNFDKNLKWGRHVSNTIKKANSSTYSLRVLNSILTRKHFKQIIHAFFISKLMYGSQIWAGCINASDTRRINTLLFKIMRLYCKDHNRTLTNRELCLTSGLRTFNSMRIVTDAVMLHNLFVTPINTNLTLRLIEQCSFNSRYPQRPFFFDYSVKQVGRNSFINRAKRIAELIPFTWPDMSRATFKFQMKTVTPNHIV